MSVERHLVPPTCPNAPDDDRRPVRDHRLHTNTRADVVDGTAVLVVRARCSCGWADETVLDGGEGSEGSP